MEERPRSQGNAQGFRHRVMGKLRFGALKRPRWMMNLPANDLATPIGRIQAIPFGQEIFQRTTSRGKHFANRAISALQQRSRRSAMRSLAVVVIPAILACAAHSRSKIR